MGGWSAVSMLGRAVSARCAASHAADNALVRCFVRLQVWHACCYLSADREPQHHVYSMQRHTLSTCPHHPHMLPPDNTLRCCPAHYKTSALPARRPESPMCAAARRLPVLLLSHGSSSLPGLLYMLSTPGLLHVWFFVSRMCVYCICVIEGAWACVAAVC